MPAVSGMIVRTPTVGTADLGVVTPLDTTPYVNIIGLVLEVTWQVQADVPTETVSVTVNGVGVWHRSNYRPAAASTRMYGKDKIFVTPDLLDGSEDITAVAAGLNAAIVWNSSTLIYLA